VIRSHYGHGFAKQYVRDDRFLRERMSHIADNYHNVQQDVLETFVDHGNC